MLTKTRLADSDGLQANDISIAVAGISKRYRIYRRRNVHLKYALLDLLRRSRSSYDEFAALSDVSFEIPRGQVVGLIGPNGSGKSTILRIMSRIVHPDTGSVQIRGRVSSLLELGAGFNPDLSGRKNIYFYGSLLGLTKRALDAKVDEIIDFSELADFIDNPIRHYSSGMYFRLAFSVAVNVDPDILLLDEILSVGDANFQQKCLRRIGQFKRDGKTIVLVTHSMEDVVRFCDRAILLSHGRVVADGEPNHVVERYLQGVGGLHESIAHSCSPTPTVGGPKVTIRAVQPVDGDGDRIVPAGSDVHFQLELSDLDSLVHPSVSVLLANDSGVPVATLMAPTALVDQMKNCGCRNLRLSLESPPLRGGTFTANASLLDGDSVIGGSTAPATLQIATTEPGAGIVLLKHRWHLEAEEDYVPSKPAFPVKVGVEWGIPSPSAEGEG